MAAFGSRQKGGERSVGGEIEHNMHLLSSTDTAVHLSLRILNSEDPSIRIGSVKMDGWFNFLKRCKNACFR